MVRNLTNTSGKGSIAERAAARYLMSKGLKDLERNFRCKLGEIDLIMRDQDQLVFVEVRFRKSSRYGSAASTVDASKQRKLRATATYYLKVRKLLQAPVRFDVLGMQPSPSAPDDYEYQWIKSAF